MNIFLDKLKEEQNLTLTENGALTHKSTNSHCLDFFAFAGSMRNRTESDIVQLFSKAFHENKLIAMKLLFYMRDIREGQGERRLFRVILKKLAHTEPNIVIDNFSNIYEFGRWDDIFYLLGTPCEEKILELIKTQFELDLNSKNPSLLAKWLPSENASSYKTKAKAKIIRKGLGLTSKEYRIKLTELRSKLNVLESLIAKSQWSLIEYDKIPSKAGLKYKEAFKRNDFERYHEFMLDLYTTKDKPNTVNAKDLYPYEIIHKFEQSYSNWGWRKPKYPDELDIATYDKYWKNLKDYFNGKEYNNLCVVDTSGSMYGTPIEVAISLGIYTAERAKGAYANHFMTFSDEPELIKITGDNIFEKIYNISKANWGMNTDIAKTFDLLLDVAKKNKLSQDEIPQNLIIISDMEFDWCIRYDGDYVSDNNRNTLFENISKEWTKYGYEIPHLIFWNVNARQNNIPVLGTGRISYVSGFSPSIFEAVLSNKSGYELMLAAINKPRYDCIKVESNYVGL